MCNVLPQAEIFIPYADGSIGIRFTQLELDAMWMLARKRQQAKNEHAVDRRSDTSLSNIQMHYIGIKGEYAMAKYLGIGFDMRSLSDGDDYGDMLWNEKRIEIKNLQDWLVFTPGTFKADIAVLVNPLRLERDNRVIDKPAHAYRHVLLRGWIDAKTFAENHFANDFGYGIRHCIRPEQLQKMNELAFGQLLSVRI